MDNDGRSNPRRIADDVIALRAKRKRKKKERKNE